MHDVRIVAMPSAKGYNSGTTNETTAMTQFLRIETTILPGRRIEVTSPDLPESGPVEVLVVVPNTSATTPVDAPAAESSIVEFLDRLPAGPRSASSWAELDLAIDQERNAWER
jgi:hypothetical protein